MTTERSAEAALGSEAVSPSGVRVAVSPYLFRGMLVGMAAVAVAIHRTTGNRDLAWRFAKARARTLAWMLGVGVELRGREHLAGGGPFVFAPNHQSHLDILLLLGYLPGRSRFAAKRELWRHPVVGAVLDTLGMVPIDREHPERAIDSLNRAGTERDSLVVFPEGTRSRTGELLPFKNAPFGLAIAAQVPIIPVYVHHTFEILPKGAWRLRPRPIRLLAGRPIMTTGLRPEDRERLRDEVRTAMVALQSKAR